MITKHLWAIIKYEKRSGTNIPDYDIPVIQQYGGPAIFTFKEQAKRCKIYRENKDKYQIIKIYLSSNDRFHNCEYDYSPEIEN